MPISEEMPSNDATDKPGISRRRAIRLGVRAAAGATVGLATSTAWVKPAIASVKLQHGCSASAPPGKPEVEVWKDAKAVNRFGRQLTVSGHLKIRNLSQFQVVVERIKDTVQYKQGSKWKDAPTVIQSLTDCGPGSCTKVHKTCSGQYTVTAMVPLSADKFRNHIEVKLAFRDRTFDYTADIKQDLVEPPEEPPRSEPPPSEPPPSEPPPSEPPPSEAPPSEPPPSP
jgi:hypothetical protein